jgi:CDP-glucose 4,6-dehydratase
VTGDFGSLFGGVYRGRRVLVTGHTGFKGSWLALWLQQLGARVCGLALPAEGRPNHSRLLQLGLDEALVDLRDAALVRATLRRFEPDVVFHLAAQPLVRRGYREPAATFDVNVMGLVHLLDAVRATRSVRVVVNATTDKCYRNDEPNDDGIEAGGDRRHERDGAARAFSETDPLGGYDPYSASKACAELVSASYRAAFLSHDDGRGHAVALATARAGNVVGGGDWGEDRLIPDLVRAATAQGETLIRQPAAVRPWQHVLEPLAGYLCLGQRLLADPAGAAEAWNFGPPAQAHCRVEQVIETFAAAWPAVRYAIDGAAHPHEAARLHLDCRKAEQRLHWRAVWDLPTTLRRSALWYRRQHEQGTLSSHDDLRHYVADARRCAVAWAA